MIMNEKETRKKGNVTIDCGNNLAIAKDHDGAQKNYWKLLVGNSQALLIKCGKLFQNECSQYQQLAFRSVTATSTDSP